VGKTQGTVEEKLHFRGAKPRSVFVSYTRRTEQDRAACQQVLDRLRPLCRSIQVAGQRLWDECIQQAMQQASLFVVVISTGYLYSDFCMNKELATMLRRRAIEGVPVFGVLLEGVPPADFVATLADGHPESLGDVQCLPPGPGGAANRPRWILGRRPGRGADAGLAVLVRP
jgi:TIR domain